MGGEILIAVFLGLWTVLNWVIELKVWLLSKPMRIPKDAKLTDKIRFRAYKFKYNATQFKYFALDLFVTFMAIQLFAFGESFMAGIMGMLFSNLLSLIIIARMVIIKRHNGSKTNDPKDPSSYEDFYNFIGKPSVV